MVGDAKTLMALLGLCEEMVAGTLLLTIAPGPPYVPPWGPISREVFLGSEDLAASFSGALGAHRSENLLAGPKHAQKVRVGTDSVVVRY